MDRGLESLRVRGSGLGDAQGANRVPVSLQACKAKGTIATGAVLQSPARSVFFKRQNLGTRRRAIWCCEFSDPSTLARSVLTANCGPVVTQ